MIISGYRLIDIKDYEFKSKKSVIDMLGSLKLKDLIELVQLGNNGMSFDMAKDVVMDYLRDNELTSLIDEIRDKLFPVSRSQEQTSKDIKPYKNLTALYRELGQSIRENGVSYSDFWSMTTEDIFEELDLLEEHMINKKQDEVNLAHLTGAFVGMALAGKLEAEPPKVSRKAPKEDLSKYEGKLGKNNIKILEMMDNMKI